MFSFTYDNNNIIYHLGEKSQDLQTYSLTIYYLYFIDSAKFRLIIQSTVELRVHTHSYFVLLLKSAFYRESYENRRN